MHIYLKEGAVPTRCLTARQYPIHWAKAAKQATDKLLKTVIVAEEGPTTWVSPAFFVLKGDPLEKKAMKEGKTIVSVNDLRLVVDFTGLNKWVERPIHPFPSSQDIMDRIPPGSRFFAKLDCVQGYHQIELDETSSLLTTFILPNGRFRFKRAPMGLSSSSDEWCRRSDEAIKGIDNCRKIVDDIIVYGPTEQELLKTLRQILERCRSLHITISNRKFKVDSTVKFAGSIVSEEGVKPDPDKIKAIREFPTPQDRTTLRGFLGLANQLGNYHPDIAHMSTLLRPLTSTANAFVWLAEHQAAFEEMKSILTSDVIVKYFDPQLPTEVLTDASRLKGLGFALIQRGPDAKPRLVACGSRSLSGAESRYATVELECLAILFALEKCKHFLLGMPAFVVVTDHKPLHGLFKRRIDEMTNPRLLRMREKMVCFSFEVDWVAGKLHHIADALSRSPVFDPPEDFTKDIVNTVVCHAISSDPALQELFDAADDDKDYCAIVGAIKGDSKTKLPYTHPGRPFANLWDRISILEDTLLILDGHRIIVPPAVRPAILKKLHLPHAGIEKTRTSARNLYYWPGMTVDVKNMIDRCESCQEQRPHQPAEPITMRMVSRPMEEVGLDLFQAKGKHYLIMVDRYSGMPFVAELRALHTAAITQQLKLWFQDLGYPTVARSDNGPQFRSEFGAFCAQHHIIHETSSPHNPSSNGLAEAGVKNCKQLLLKTDSFAAFRDSLLEFRNTPRAEGYSPAQRFFGFRQRTTLPAVPLAHSPICVTTAEAARKKTYQRAETLDQGAVLPDILAGTRVRVQHPLTRLWDQKGEIVQTHTQGRSYDILLDDGATIRRNRRFIKVLQE